MIFISCAAIPFLLLIANSVNSVKNYMHFYAILDNFWLQQEILCGSGSDSGSEILICNIKKKVS
jgi:hypothetical protein